MAISVENLIKGRKYPFIFTLFVLFVFVIFVLFTDTHAPFNFVSDLIRSQSEVTTSSHPPSISNPPVNVTSDLVQSPSKDTSSSSPVVSNSNHSVLEPSAETLPKQDDLSPKSVEMFGGVQLNVSWKLCAGPMAMDYIPCLDNIKAIKALRSRRHMEHRERHCPASAPRCLVPLPKGYKVPVPWPKSRDMVWFDNAPHPKLVEYKKDQNWVIKDGNYFVFPGGGTQFKEGVSHYIEFIEKTLPVVDWGKHTRVILDVGCGVASFGGYLLDRGVLTMSVAPKDEHEAQIQFALERGIPAILSVIGTQRLAFPDNVYDLIHCARCRVHWHGDGGKPLMELNRVLRPGGFFIWSATPVYRDDARDQSIWKAMVALTKSMCWKVVAKTTDSTGVGLVIYQKPTLSSCYEKREENVPPLCDPSSRNRSSWYTPLDSCLAPLPLDSSGKPCRWPVLWPERLRNKPVSLSTERHAEEIFSQDTKHWSALVSEVYLEGMV
ncbi:Sarcosine/dimethylglycine N-methyltransferase [Bertholletia excelsa]